MTRSHSPLETSCRLDFHCEGLLASDSMVWVLDPASAIFFMPRSASSKKPRSPSGPETTETTDRSEERRVGKERRTGRRAAQQKKQRRKTETDERRGRWRGSEN